MRAPVEVPAEPGATHMLRRDIQGLRMIAVVAVVVNHLTGHPRGAFVGVDVFFVISGYLITGLLTRELARTGRISLRGFYARRIRRLFPAAWLVTALTIVAGYRVFDHSRAVETAHDGFWATVFLANWHLINANTDYFSQGLPPSPLQHYWSLSVEEQFYVVWPLVLLVAALPVMMLARRSRQAPRAARSTSLVLGVLVFGASLAWAFHERTDPSLAYFSTLTRAWELALGAVCAFLAPMMRGGRTLLTTQSWIGVGLIAVSLFVVRGDRNFPAPDALLPCLGAALVILAVTAKREAVNPLLTNPVSVYIGDISYSIYLVHFPIIILLGVKEPGRGAIFYAVATLLILGASIMLHSGVERPILDSRWLQPKVGQAVASNPRLAARTVLIGTAIAVLAVAVYTLRPEITPSGGLTTDIQNQILGETTTQQPRATSQISLPQARLSDAIEEALLAEKWPSQVISSINEASANAATTATIARFAACGALPLSPARSCTFGPRHAKRTMYLVGDSTALGYAQSLLAALRSAGGWRLRVAGTPGCPFTDRELVPQISTAARCEAHNQAAIAEIRASDPDVVAITSEPNKRTDAATGAVLTEDEWATTMTSTIRRLSPSKVMLLTAPPSDDQHDVRSCYSTGIPPASCAFKVKRGFLTRMTTETRVARATGATYINSIPWFCDVRQDFCPPFVGDDLTHADGVHMAAVYSGRLAPVMLAELRRDKIVG